MGTGLVLLACENVTHECDNVTRLWSCRLVQDIIDIMHQLCSMCSYASVISALTNDLDLWFLCRSSWSHHQVIGKPWVSSFVPEFMTFKYDELGCSVYWNRHKFMLAKYLFDLKGPCKNNPPCTLGATIKPLNLTYIPQGFSTLTILLPPKSKLYELSA